MPEGALTSLTIGLCDACRYSACLALLLTSQSRARTEYLIETENILVVG